MNFEKMTKEELLETLFNNHFDQENKDKFFIHLRKSFETKEKESCALTITKDGSKRFYIQLDSTVLSENSSECKTTVLDITERKRARANSCLM